MAYSIYALTALLKALAPLIGYEKKHNQPFPSSSQLKDEELEELTELGLSILPSLEAHTQTVTSKEYGKQMARRLGMKENDESGVTRPLLDLMQERGWDFHNTFRALAVGEPLPDQDSESEIGKAVTEWVGKWQANAIDRDALIEANPKFVLRQWVLEEVIKDVEADLEDPEKRFEGRRKLNKVLEMAQRPFERWGGEGKDEALLSDEEKEERRLCSVGGEDMLGFQCSCSS